LSAYDAALAAARDGHTEDEVAKAFGVSRALASLAHEHHRRADQGSAARSISVVPGLRS
jgi:hypothetical protein